MLAAASPQNVNLTLPDGSVRTVAAGTTGGEVATQIAVSLGKAAVAIKINGAETDLSVPITADAHIEIIKRDSDAGLELIRHDCAHVLAEAVQTLFPGTQVTIGPVIESGFYYDFYRPEQPFTTEDFAAIEKKMHDIVDRASPFKREVWTRDQAVQYFTDKGELFKAELIRDLPETEEIKVYDQGGWLDLCRGPHMPTTKHVGHAFKLMKVAGAYWRGDSNREMLSRIYGTAWRNDAELQAHLTQIEEAEKRDHRKLGREMDLFHLQDEAQGSVFWHPRGFVIYNQLEAYIRRRLLAADYVEVKTPQLMDARFWQASGHWDKYRENMFVVPDVIPNTDDVDPFKGKKVETLMALKPMNCPAHVQIFKQGIKSYRDLPIRMAEFGCCHRNEVHGALHGIMRLRQFIQDDAHIFCRDDQVMGEVKSFCQLVKAVYQDMGFDNYIIKVETRPDKRHGSDAVWDRAEGALFTALDELKMPYQIAPGDGAFYGPKLAFIIRDAIGREWGCGTIQVDFVLPERLDATYIGEDGQKHRPVMLHRAILGAIERFIGILIESTAGKLPLWLAPTQVVVATITSDADGYARQVLNALKEQGIRAEIDLRNEKINYKVREHSLMKVPVMFVVGAREAAEGKVAVRTLGGEAQTVKTQLEAISDLVNAARLPY
jgi:threonyl-tRNA synthetase